MSLSLDKLNRRRAKKSVAKIQSPEPRQRPWAPVKPMVKKIEAEEALFSDIWTDSGLERNWCDETSAPEELNLENGIKNLKNLSSELVSHGQNKVKRLKKELGRPRSIKWMGVELEVGKQFRLHLPALKRRS